MEVINIYLCAENQVGELNERQEDDEKHECKSGDVLGAS